MTVGIYRIEFKDSSFYIGKSSNIERRIYEHSSKLAKGLHYNILIQKKYGEYKDFTYQVLEECSIEQLTAREQGYLDEIDYTSEKCLNISKSSILSCTGIKNCMVSSTEEQLIKVFSMLLERCHTHEDISLVTGVPVGSITHISCGNSHNWLKNYFGSRYEDYINISINKVLGRYTKEGIRVLQHKDGRIYEFESQSTACKDLGLRQSHISEVLHGKRKTHKGWFLLK